MGARVLINGTRYKLVFSKGPIGWHVRGFSRAEQAAGPTGASRGGDHSAATRPPFILRPFVPFDPAKLPPREFLFGKHYQRRVVGGTVAPGDFGKTSLCMVEQVSMATARNLLGEQPTERLRVWYHNGEDSLEELNRRLAAICQHYDIPQSELRGWFFMTSGNEVPLRVAKGYSNLVINTGLIENINNQIGDNKVDVATFDPLVTLHGVPENDTGKMDTVVRIFAGIADQQNCAIELSHHTRKLMAGSTADYSVDDMRGAGAVKDAMRAVRMLNRMTPKDAEDVGIPEHERAAYFRLDRVKGNNSRPALATWRRFVNVELPNTDEVGVVVPWEFPGQGAAPSPEKAEAERKVEHVFLALLLRFTNEGRVVNDRPGSSNAPNLFAQEPEAKLAKVGKKPLAEAMRRLFAAGKIRVEPYGRADRPSYKIIMV
jgi:RecA-family ATPase